MNYLGKKTDFTTVPFFWTQQYGKSIRYSGFTPEGFDSTVIQGNIDEGQFAVYYCKDDEVVALATLGKDPLCADFANLLDAGKKMKKEDINTEWNKNLI